MALKGVWSRLTGAITGFAIGNAASDAMRPLFELVRQDSWHANPNRVLDVTTLAELVAKAIASEADAADHARRTGYSINRLRALTQLALRTPAMSEILTMRRRGTITDAQLEHALRKAGIEPQYDQAVKDLLEVLPSVTDMVRFGVREVYDPGQRAALDLDAEYPVAFGADARRIGLSEQSARNYWAAHWELPSYTQATEMLFRRVIDFPTFQRLLKALDYAPTWRGPLEAIARRIPTISDMIRFAQREVYDPAQRQALGLDADYPAAFTEQASLHGMSETHAREYWAAHWRLPSARQGYQMLWRGLIGTGELDGLLKALDYPPLWRNRLRDIAFLVPGRVDLRRMLRAGVLTEAQVDEGYRKIGYAAADAAILTQFAVRERDLHAAGGDLVRKYRGSVVTRAHKEYLEQSLDEAGARQLLAQLGVSADVTNEVLPLWTIERDLFRRELTPVQIRSAYKKGRFTLAEALARLEDAGMTPADADTFLQS